MHTQQSSLAAKILPPTVIFFATMLGGFILLGQDVGELAAEGAFGTVLAHAPKVLFGLAAAAAIWGTSAAALHKNKTFSGEAGCE